MLKVPGLSNKVQQPCMNRTVCAEQSSLTPMVSLQSMGASAVCTTSDVIMQPAVPLAVPATGVPQVVAFAALPAVSENMMPQVVAMATIPGASNQPQMVALPLCSWPYDPMMFEQTFWCHTIRVHLCQWFQWSANLITTCVWWHKYAACPENASNP